MFNFVDLDDRVRECMLKEFTLEQQSGDPYLSKRLSSEGLLAFPDLMSKAITEGDEESLLLDLTVESFWLEAVLEHVSMLAYTEFNTWYVRGFTRMLLEEGVSDCLIYDASPELSLESKCNHYLENQTVEVKEVYLGHRRRYHGPNRSYVALSIPEHPNCGLSVCRVT